MKFFGDSFEAKCPSCGESLLICNEDTVHKNADGSFVFLCAVCAKKENSEEARVIYKHYTTDDSLFCQDCEKTLTLMDNFVSCDDFILCFDCDDKRKELLNN